MTTERRGGKEGARSVWKWSTFGVHLGSADKPGQSSISLPGVERSAAKGAVARCRYCIVALALGASAAVIAPDANADPRAPSALCTNATTSGAPIAVLADATTSDAPTPARPSSASSRQPDSAPDALAIAAAVVPGVLVHGSGHWLLGERETAARLLALEAVGLSAFLAGGLPIVLLGASRYIVGPAAALVVGGVGVFGISFLADVYGVAMPESARGAPLRYVPSLETELGYAYIHDPQFEYANFLRQGVTLRFDRWFLNPNGWFALDDTNLRWQLAAGHRFYGPLPESSRRPATDGSFLDVRGAATHHQFQTEGFKTLTAELGIEGRLDLRRIGSTLHGSFAELGAGFALETFDYEVAGLGFPTELTELLLVRFAFGMYLDRNGSEFSMYYDHRHDDFAAGLKLEGLGSGVAGHFGSLARIYFAKNWGLLADIQAGSAYIARLSALFRFYDAP
jgi:hypothetical protein